MRSDMFKVIVERERLGGGRSRKGKQKDPDSLPQKEGIRRPHRASRKSLNENLSPLKRFLNSAVGRPWDKVFSEMCEHINVNSTVQKHIREHIFQYVERYVLITAEGKVTEKRGQYGYACQELWHGELFIHPKNGLLTKYKRKDRKSRNSAYYSRGRTPSTPTLASIISNLLAKHGAKGKTVEKEGVYYKVFFNPGTNAWDIFYKASAAHARIDFIHHFGYYSWLYEATQKDTDRIFSEYRKNFATSDSPYLKKLLELYGEAVKYKREVKEKEEQKKKDAIAKKLWQKECPHFSGIPNRKK